MRRQVPSSAATVQVDPKQTRTREAVDFMAMAASIESKTSTFKLLDGHSIPVFGLGVYLAKANGETEQAVLWALKHGYRLIDTAAIYK